MKHVSRYLPGIPKLTKPRFIQEADEIADAHSMTNFLKSPTTPIIQFLLDVTGL